MKTIMENPEIEIKEFIFSKKEILENINFKEENDIFKIIINNKFFIDKIKSYTKNRVFIYKYYEPDEQKEFYIENGKILYKYNDEFNEETEGEEDIEDFIDLHGSNFFIGIIEKYFYSIENFLIEKNK